MMANQSRVEQDREWGLISITMTQDAAHRFNDALRYAEAVVHNHMESCEAPVTRAKMEKHGEWLRWGLGRLDQARHAVANEVMDGRDATTPIFKAAVEWARERDEEVRLAIRIEPWEYDYERTLYDAVQAVAESTPKPSNWVADPALPFNAQGLGLTNPADSVSEAE